MPVVQSAGLAARYRRNRRRGVVGILSPLLFLIA